MKLTASGEGQKGAKRESGGRLGLEVDCWWGGGGFWVLVGWHWWGILRGVVGMIIFSLGFLYNFFIFK